MLSVSSRENCYGTRSTAYKIGKGKEEITALKLLLINIGTVRCFFIHFKRYVSLRQEGQCRKIFQLMFNTFMKGLQLNPWVLCLLIYSFSQVAIFLDSPQMATLLTGETKLLDKIQYWWFGSAGSAGSARFWASQIRIRIYESEVWIRIRLRIQFQIRILPFSSLRCWVDWNNACKI